MKTHLALLLALVACSRSPQLRDDNSAAHHLRLLEVPASEHVYELRWNMPEAIPEPEGYIVLQAPFPITDANRERAESMVVGADGIDPTRPGPEAQVRLEPDSGVHYFAILAILAGPRAGPQSDLLSVDTTQRAAWIETRADGGADLVIGDLAGNALTIQRIDHPTIDAQWSPTGNLLGFVHDGMLGLAASSGLPQTSGNELARTSMAPVPVVESFRFGASGTSVGILGRAFFDQAAGL